MVSTSWGIIRGDFHRLQPVMFFRKSNENSIFELSRLNSGKERLKTFLCFGM